ncbi:KpsF/GutQ family sugar-phosphate isomerase [Chitinimonas viridis]|uniref:KpsF/GutQ family sugar-phosphate isomerase n=2 Tax=Chitinimonas TaxID=240411 RepID=A0ABT8B2P4_9NEIS|nr:MULTISPECIES: KpsF/GutQ family sugar-phosphate isomerase [Chitinimonas]MDN3575936.1 KpsF/GutQ family sugar-phosphate isomerase [Chitinimonas viridis]GLR14066.1 arabinose-5-phosphate isomerase [Chitinimonas prasina]
MTTQHTPNAAELLALARDVLNIEAQAIQAVAGRLDDSFIAAHQLMLGCQGRVVVAGMGKSGHVGRKLAATLASTGTPAFFMHPAEAAHGDLGMITADDIVLALSNSGESDELVTLLPAIKRKGARMIAMTGNPDSTLGQAADIHLNARVEKEACPLNLAPTASTTAALALGDALAVCLLEARGFGRDDFALSHPGGSLGRRLLVHVRDVMRQGDELPMVKQTASVRDALFEITRKGLGMTAVVDDHGKLQGIFTDGDLRRAMDRELDLKAVDIAQLMTRNPKTIAAHKLAAEAVQLMEQAKVYVVLVLDEGKLVGALRMHDLLRAGVV